MSAEAEFIRSKGTGAVRMTDIRKIFIDGGEGTTGLRILERFEGRRDVQLLHIDSELRKDAKERKRLIDESDITFLCLPDAAAIEAVELVDKDNDHTVIIDASTAHRTLSGWVYGLPELGKEYRSRIADSLRIAVPGCYASGFNMIVYPLVKMNIISPDYPVYATALSGYSGAGRKAIAVYESGDKGHDLYAPREYALTQAHKHLKEMKAISGLVREPLFTPVVDDYYSGMIVSVPLYSHLLARKATPEALRDMYAEFYDNEAFIKVREYGYDGIEPQNGFLAANAYSGRDDAELIISGNSDRILVSARFDNLGKGASGAAIQCMNIKLGVPEDTGLNIGG